MFYPSIKNGFIFLTNFREVTETLAILQDKAPSVDFDEVIKIFIEDLGEVPGY